MIMANGNHIPNDNGVLSGRVKFVQKAVVFHPKQNWLLGLQRPHDDPLYEGPWDLPGGKVEFGENHIEAINREIAEETGLETTAVTLQCLNTAVSQKSHIYYILVGYHCRATHEDICLSHEHYGYQWFTPDEFLRRPSTPFLQQLVREVYGSSLSA